MDDWMMFQFISQYSNNFRNISEEYQCTLCHKLLCNPYCAKCGCSFCKGCIEEQFSNDKSCPGGNEYCGSTNLDNAEFSIDHVARNKIKKLELNCPKDDCGFRSNIENVMHHFVECEIIVLPCEFSGVGCDVKLQKECIEKHLNENVVKHLNCLLRNAEETKKEIRDLKIENIILRQNIGILDDDNWDKINEFDGKVCELEKRNDCLFEKLKKSCNKNDKIFTQLQTKVEELENANKENLCKKMTMNDNNNNCNHDKEIKKLQDRVKALEKQNSELTMEIKNDFVCKMEKIQNDRIINKLQTKVEELEKNANKIENLCKKMTMNDNNNNCNHDEEINKFHDRVKTLEKQNSELTVEIKNNFVCKMKKLQNDNEAIKLTQTRLQRSLGQASEGVMDQLERLNDLLEGQIIDELEHKSFTWKVESLPAKRRTAKRGECVMICSDKFNICKNGYRMQIRIYPNGTGCGENTHLSVYFVICRGDYDEILDWPLKETVKVCLINPTNWRQEFSTKMFNYQTVPHNCQVCFYKPRQYSNNNIGYGFHTFISWAELKNSSLSPMKNGTIFIRLSLV